jgi:hypothetical protein
VNRVLVSLAEDWSDDPSEFEYRTDLLSDARCGERGSSNCGHDSEEEFRGIKDTPFSITAVCSPVPSGHQSSEPDQKEKVVHSEEN